MKFGLAPGRQGLGRFREPDPERGRDLPCREHVHVSGRHCPGRTHGPEHEPGLEPGRELGRLDLQCLAEADSADPRGLHCRGQEV